MLASFHVRKKDLVQIMVGREKGKTGKVLKVNLKKGYITVEKLNMLKKHSRPTGKAPGGIVDLEGPIAFSNVLLYCDKCAKGVRTAVRSVGETGKKARFCKKCKTQLDK